LWVLRLFDSVRRGGIGGSTCAGEKRVAYLRTG
jgi:hypothetical protein